MGKDKDVPMDIKKTNQEKKQDATHRDEEI
jgi:hypothetical protein